MFQRNLQRIVVGSALAIATTALIPVIKNTLRPLAHSLSKEVKYLIVLSKEGLEDMAAEVRFERMKKSMNHDSLIDYVLDEEEDYNRYYN